jgi:large subunit ribosomal protein L13
MFNAASTDRKPGGTLSRVFPFSEERAMSLTQITKVHVADVPRRWFQVDADGMVLGRVANIACQLLRGKGKVSFTPHLDQGDGVVVLNAAKVVLTGKKDTQKLDFRASGYPGGQTYTKYGRLMAEHPERAVELAVSGMLPKNRLRDRFLRRLKVFRDDAGARQYPYALPVDVKNKKIHSGGPYVAKAAPEESK